MTQRILFIENLKLFLGCGGVVQLILHCRIIFKSQFLASKQGSHVPKKILDTKWPDCLEMFAISL